MYRFALDYLKEWKDKQTRRPIIIRGARQVGKSFLVKMFGEQHFKNVLEINFEKTPEIASLFKSNSPRTIIGLLETRFNIDISAGKTLIFLDEIQATPEIIASLRYFYEDMPDLHVIAAGSLLEFAFEKQTFSMPVGRIEYLHLGPVQFGELLLAQGKDNLHKFLNNFSVGEIIPQAIHMELMRLLKQFIVVGGMPEAVDTYLRTNSYRTCDEIKQSIISTYSEDFNKYGRRVDPSRIQKVFSKIPQLVGNKFKYSHVDRDEKSRDIQQVLNLLALAKVVHPVFNSHCNGVPLGAEKDERNFKVLFLDVGLLCRSCGLGITEFEGTQDITVVNAGSVSEQFIGQHLLYSKQFFEEPELYCWMREKKNSSAEVDFVISIGVDIIPVEVKAGKGGTLKSMHLFLREKKRDIGLRFNSDYPSLLDTTTSLPDGNNKRFRLLSLPLYLVGQARRLCKMVLNH